MALSSLFGYPNLLALAIFVFAYLLGSIPFGLIFTLLAGKGDIRNIGSGNIGTTNVLRTGSKKLAFFTLIGDVLKGTFAVLCARYLFTNYFMIPLDCAENIYIPLAGLCAFLGHLYPIWLKFKGGKGVATYIGVLLGLIWPVALLFILLWLLSAYITKYSSLSALIASAFLPFFVYSYNGVYISGVIALMTILIFIKHWANIKRLCQGNESKIGQGKNDKINKRHSPH